MAKKKILSRKSESHSSPWFEHKKGFMIKLRTSTVTSIFVDEKDLEGLSEDEIKELKKLASEELMKGY